MTIARLRIAGLLLAILIFPSSSSAESSSLFHLTESAPLNEVWLNPGFYSWHFDHEVDLDGNNYGFGAEYRYSTTQSLMAGRYHNSDRAMSSYAVWLWQPFQAGELRLGALAGVIDGYRRANGGNWFPMLIPVASFEYGKVGINFTVVPTIPDTVYGSFTIQLKLKVN